MRASRPLLLAVAGTATALTVLPTTQAAASPESRLRTVLSGAAEQPGTGDPDGTGRARVRIDTGTGEICFRLRVHDIAPAVAAHIHVAPAGQAGPIVVPLTAPSSGRSRGCVTVDPALARAIASNPADYYVNVHNTDFPAGALRGQLG